MPGRGVDSCAGGKAMNGSSMDARNHPPRDARAALLRGFTGRCPNCGRGKLFRAYLKVVDRCAVCGEDFSHHRADDAPAYFVILIVGHLVVPWVLIVEEVFAPSYWVHAAIWLPLIIGLSLGLLQPVKGTIVAWQWAHFMHGFERTREGSRWTAGTEPR
jgi:uncharacterized protein (DUF983 family)